MNRKLNILHMLKKQLLIILTVSLVMSLVGCASQAESNQNSEYTQETYATDDANISADSSITTNETKITDTSETEVPESEMDSVAEYELEYYSLDDVILNSDVAIVGEYVETIQYENYTEQKFIVKDCLYGDVTDDEIYLYSNLGIANIAEIDYTYNLGEDIYTEGTEYILVMEKLQSVFYEHDRYMCSAEILLCEETGIYLLYSEPISVSGSIRDYIVNIYNSVAQEDVIETVYESDIAELVGESKYIGVVNIQSLFVEGTVQNSNTYSCVVESLILGDNLNTYSDGTILLSVKKNTVEVGESYVICFTSSSDTSLIYSQSTSDAVFALDDEKVSEIEVYVAKNMTE